ncbi:unnamed protein product [Darwinula stevensoni]|uniref:Uncharacterized protein n=1 Tax=Darwinula stevensoni TaxID=69355 RepID=A0A7R8X634_9CRUS|nr:unnamed protein product [Darwinula stevensoni]CAG0887199.1 unnamed protein product [Darwinula stevensoni]
MSFFKVSSNMLLTELPEGVFGTVSFERIEIIYVPNLVTVHPSVILQSRDTLQSMMITSGRLGDFPWSILPEMNSLKNVSVEGHSLTSLPVLQSSTLEGLYLQLNSISAVEAGWSMPLLKNLYLDGNPITKLPTGLLEEFANLENFSCMRCSMGPTIHTDSLNFNSNVLEVLDLGYNGITFLEPGAITGLARGPLMFLNNNLITEIAEESFRPMVEVLSMGPGVIILSAAKGNLHECLSYRNTSLF